MNRMKLGDQQIEKIKDSIIIKQSEKLKFSDMLDQLENNYDIVNLNEDEK